MNHRSHLKQFGSLALFLRVAFALSAMQIADGPAALNFSFHQDRQLGKQHQDEFLCGLNHNASVCALRPDLFDREHLVPLAVHAGSQEQIAFLDFSERNHDYFAVLALAKPNCGIAAYSAVHTIRYRPWEPQGQGPEVL